MGYTLVYGIIELINFAHGDVFTMGSFTAAGFFTTLGLGVATGPVGIILGLLLTLIVSMLVCGSLNVLIERVAYRPLRNAPKLAPLITAVGFSFILQDVGFLWRGPSPSSVPDLIRYNDVVVNISGVAVRRADVLALGVAIPLVFALNWFISTTAPAARCGPPRRIRGRAADGDQRRQHDLADLHARRTCSPARPAWCTRCTRRRSYLQPRLRGRLDRVHRGRDGRHRQHPRRGPRWPLDRLHPTDLGLPHWTQWTEAIVFLYLILVMILAPARAARRGNARGRIAMNEGSGQRVELAWAAPAARLRGGGSGVSSRS